MVDLFTKMGDALETMESDIREMNACLKVLAKQVILEDQEKLDPLDMEQAEELSNLGIISEREYGNIHEKFQYRQDQEQAMDMYTEFEFKDKPKERKSLLNLTDDL